MDDEIIIGVENKKAPSKNKKTSKKTSTKKNNKNKVVKSKKGKVRKEAKIVFGILIFVIAAILLLCSPIFDIKHIEVSGNSKNSKEKIILMYALPTVKTPPRVMVLHQNPAI